MKQVTVFGEHQEESPQRKMAYEVFKWKAMGRKALPQALLSSSEKAQILTLAPQITSFTTLGNCLNLCGFQVLRL